MHIGEVMNIPIENVLEFIKDLVSNQGTKMLMVFSGVFGLCWGMKDGWVPSIEGTYGVIGIVIFGLIARLIQDLKKEEFCDCEKSPETNDKEAVKIQK